MEHNHGYLLEDLAIYPDENLIVGPDRSQKIAPKVMDLLVYLINGAESVISRDDLLENVWPNRFGADESLSRSISELRKAISFCSNINEQFIATIPKKGYKLCFPSQIINRQNHGDNDNFATSHISKRKLTIIGTGIIVLAILWSIWQLNSINKPPKNNVKSIAVLAFDNLTDEADMGLLGDGLAEEIINQLATVKNLTVASRFSSFYFKNKTLPLAEIANKLNVKYLLEGSIRKFENHIRITVSLTNVQSNHYLWTESFDYSENNLINIEEQTAQTVVQLIYPTDTDNLNLKNNNISPKAYNQYVLATQLLHGSKPGQLPRARKLFKTILAQNPNYVPALTNLALTITTQANWGQIPQDVAFPITKQLLERAKSLGASSAQYYLALAYLYTPKPIVERHSDITKARIYYDQSLALDPQNCDTIGSYANSEMVLGNSTKAESIILAGIKTCPFSYGLFTLLGNVYINSGNISKADYYGKKSIKLNPNAPANYELMAEIAFDRGDLLLTEQYAMQCLIRDARFMNCWQVRLDIYSGLNDKKMVDVLLNNLANFAPVIAFQVKLMKLINQRQWQDARMLVNTLTENDISKPFMSDLILSILSHHFNEPLTVDENKLVNLALLFITSDAQRTVHMDIEKLYQIYWHIQQSKEQQQLTHLINQFSNKQDKMNRDKFFLAELYSLQNKRQSAITILKSLITNNYVREYIPRFCPTYDSPFFNNLMSTSDYQALKNQANTRNLRLRKQLYVQREKLLTTEAFIQSPLYSVFKSEPTQY